MALTSPDGLPYPTDYADPADTPAALEDLAVATQTGLSARALASNFGTWINYSPNLYQHGIAYPASVVSARYMQSGKLVIAQVDVRADTNWAGSTDPWIRCALPVAARSAPGVPIGSGRYSAPHAPAVWRVHCNIVDAWYVGFEATHLVTETYMCIGENPWHIITNGDAIQFVVAYEAA